VQIDALDSALQGVKRANHLNKPALLDLSRNILSFWDDLPTIAARRDFAERLLDAPADGRHEVKPKTSGKDEERTGPFYCKNVDGSAASELHTLRKLNELLKKGHIEITKLSTSSCRKISRKGKTETDTSHYQFCKPAKTCGRIDPPAGERWLPCRSCRHSGKTGCEKLGEVADENLADVIAQAEKALEG
jgi:hypothetical protein